MQESTLQLWRWTGIMLVSGGIIFWIGACTPPYRWWMTSDLKEYLTLIHDNKTIWYFIAATFALGVVMTVFGIQLFSLALQEAQQKIMPQIGNTAIAFGIAMHRSRERAATGESCRFF